MKDLQPLEGHAAAAYRLYLTLSGTAALSFTVIATVNLVYQAEVARLNPLQLVLVGTLLESVCFLFEIPTGVVADVYSRRLSVIIGTFLFGAGFLLEGSIPTFTAILLSQVIWGIGATFISGAQDAWIADEVGEAAAGAVFLRGSQVTQLCTLIGIPLSVALASIRLNVPILTGGALFVALGVYLVFRMPEHAFHPTPREERGSWQAMGDTLRDGTRLVRGRPLLLTILGITAFFGMTSEGIDRLWQAHFLRDLTLPALAGLKPVVWFGVIAGATALLGIGATEVVKRRLDTRDHSVVTRLLLVITALRVAGVVAFGLAGSFPLAVATFLVAATLRRVTYPLYAAWLNQNIDSRVRATVLSMNSQIDALGQIAGGPVIGAIGTIISLRAALVVAGATLAPALLFLTRAIRLGAHVEPVPAQPASEPAP